MRANKCGTALTDQQITLLSRYTRYAIIMLDGDEAGQTNGIRSARLLVEKGFSVGRIVLESGQLFPNVYAKGACGQISLSVPLLSKPGVSLPTIVLSAGAGRFRKLPTG